MVATAVATATVAAAVVVAAGVVMVAAEVVGVDGVDRMAVAAEEIKWVLSVAVYAPSIGIAKHSPSSRRTSIERILVLPHAARGRSKSSGDPRR